MFKGPLLVTLRKVVLFWTVLASISLHCQAASPGPVASLASTRCRTCPPGDSDSDLTLNITVLVETDVAQFYSYTSDGAILVYFVARASFSEAPSQLELEDFQVQEGSVLEIVAENGCTDFLLKGTVKQSSAWLSRTTEIKVSAKANATSTCQGRPFPAAETSTTSRNGPIGSMYIPNMAYTAAGAVTSAATNYIRLSFSEPISGLAITQFNVTLSAPQATASSSGSNGNRKLLQAEAPTSEPCVAAYKSQAVPAVENSTQFYNVFITVPDCYYGAVNVHFVGEVKNEAGLQSLPVKPVGFNRVPIRPPIFTYSAYETLPGLGVASACSQPQN